MMMAIFFLKNQIIVDTEKFADGGDSGSLLNAYTIGLNNVNLHPIGIIHMISDKESFAFSLKNFLKNNGSVKFDISCVEFAFFRDNKYFKYINL